MNRRDWVGDDPVFLNRGDPTGNTLLSFENEQGITIEEPRGDSAHGLPAFEGATAQCGHLQLYANLPANGRIALTFCFCRSPEVPD